MNKATIYDFARMCKKYIGGCKGCPLYSFNYEITGRCRATLQTYPDKANEIILNWCKEHPVETRQDRFLKMFPKAVTNGNGRISICPKNIDKTHECELKSNECANCMEEYWLTEVEE
jgi:hypothetical protein